MATPISIGLPSFSGVGSVSRFLSDFKTFAVLHDWEDKKQLALLPLCLSGIARDAYDGLSDKCKKDLKSVLDALEAAFPSGGPVEAQVKLRGLKFVPGQNLDAFTIQLRSLVGAAFPGTVVDQLLFNYFLQSLPDDFQRQIVCDGIVTYDEALKKVRNMTYATRMYEGSSVAVRQVSEGATRTDHLERRVRELEGKLAKLQTRSGSTRTCFCCGKSGHLRSACRKRHLTCYVCREVGHLAAVCSKNVLRARPSGEPRQQQPGNPQMLGSGAKWDARQIPSQPTTSASPSQFR